MLVLAVVAAVLAALFHVVVFVMESVLWTRPAVWHRFGLASQADADTNRLLAFNQGFYNLFLAIGALVGVVLVAAGNPVVGGTLIGFAMACMLGAGVVLIVSSRGRLARSALLQAGPPLIALIGLAAA